MCGAEARLPHPVGLAPQLKQGLRGGPAPQRPAEKRGKRWARVAVTAVPAQAQSSGLSRTVSA